MEQANSIDEYLKLLERYYTFKEIYFRGQLEKYSTIPPSIARDEGYLESESLIFHESVNVKKGEFELLNSPIEKLSKLQHYGIPTRLIDVTVDPLIALYFAVENIADSSHGIVLVYLAKGHNFDSKAAKILSIIPTLRSPNYTEVALEYNKIFNDTISHEEIFEYIGSPIFIRHCETLRKLNPRLHSQKGAFLICGNERSNDQIFNELRSLDTITPNIKIRIPYEYKIQIKKELDHKYGINKFTIYPEFPSVADYIREKYKKENVSFESAYNIVSVKDTSYRYVKRTSINVVLNKKMNIEHIKSMAISIIKQYETNNDVVWIYVSNSADDYVVSNWILQGQWISQGLDGRLHPIKFEEECENSYFWNYNSSYSTLSDYYDRYVFDEDKNLFIYYNLAWKSFIPILEEIKGYFQSSELNDTPNFLDEIINKTSEIRALIDSFGRSRNSKMNSYLEKFSEAISQVYGLIFTLEDDDVGVIEKEKSIYTYFFESNNLSSSILSETKFWEKELSISENDYLSIDIKNRKNTSYSYTQTLPINDDAVMVEFSHKVVLHHDKTLHIEGTTNLFDGASLMLSLSLNRRLLCQGHAEVQKGVYVFPKFSNKGDGFDSGNYFAEITLSIPETQPKDFTKLAGLEYENITGEFVDRSGIGPVVAYSFNFDIV